jgi:hypothetical protein
MRAGEELKYLQQAQREAIQAIGIAPPATILYILHVSRAYLLFIGKRIV